jgi:hypothetical protein
MRKEERRGERGVGCWGEGRPKRFGLLSFLFFLSLFYFFTDFQTQIHFNSNLNPTNPFKQTKEMHQHECTNMLTLLNKF